MRTPKAVVVERTFNASVAQVWKALTTAEHMHRWFFDLKEFKAAKGFKFAFDIKHEGFMYAHRCTVMEAIPNKKLAYTWRYEGFEGDSLVTIELSSKGKKTKLKLTHTGLETFPDLPSFDKKNFLRGWTHIIGGGFKGYIEGADREMFITRLIAAPRERVWDAFVNPKKVAKWWGPNGFSTTIEKMDVRPGGVWNHTMKGPDGTEYPNKNTFIDVVKHERIVYKITNGKRGAEGISFISTWTFEAKGKQTLVALRGVFKTPAERDRVVKQSGAIEGGKQTLARLGEFVAKR